MPKPEKNKTQFLTFRRKEHFILVAFGSVLESTLQGPPPLIFARNSKTWVCQENDVILRVVSTQNTGVDFIPQLCMAGAAESLFWPKC